MDDGPGYDTSNLQALRQELRRLNIAAIETRLLPPLGGRHQRPSVSAASEAARPASTRNGKAGAKRLLSMLRRSEGDDSPPVPGTDFTEAGVVRLLAHLRHAGNKKPARYLQRLRRYLARPVQFGMRVSAGVSVERLQWVSRYLRDIEAYGLDHVRMVTAARRGRQARPPSSTEPRSPDVERPTSGAEASHASVGGRAEAR